MSLDVFVWDAATNGTLPTSYSQADESLSHWMTVKTTEVNPKFIAFAKQLNTLIKQQAEPDDELLAFYESFIKETEQVQRAVYVVGLPSYNFIGALRLIVQSAAQCHLTVMYGPPATLFLPNNQTLPPEQKTLWQMAWEHMDEAQEYPLKLKDFKKMIEPQFEALAIQNGFVKGVYPYPARLRGLTGKKGYIKNVPFGQQFVYITCEGGAGDYEIIINAFLLSDQYKSISESFGVENDFNAITPLFLAKLKHPTTGSIFKTCRVHNLEEFNEFMQKIETIWFPLMNRIQTIQDVDSLFHGELSVFFKLNRIYPYSLIVAKLAGNPHFEAFVEKERTDPTFEGWASPRFKEELAPKMPALIQYLQQLVV